MNWFFIAVGAPFLFAVVNISDQYLVSRYSTGERGSGGLVLFSSLIGILAAIVISVFTVGVFAIPILDKFLLILTGGLTIAWVILYLFTLEIESVSAVVPWFLTVPVFGYVLGYIFLNETLSFPQILGSLIVLLGAFLISIDFSSPKIKLKWQTVSYMLVACFLIAVIGVIFKYVTVDNSFWVSSFWVHAGLGIFGIILYIFVPQYRNEFMMMNKQGGKKIFTLNVISESLTIAGNLLTYGALLLAPVTLVYLVGSFQPAILLSLTLLATWFLPHIVKEDMSSRILLPKIASIFVIILGSIILFV